MSKFFSKKFILIFLLTAVLWGGVGSGVEHAFAADIKKLSEACGETPTSTNDARYPEWDACRTQWNADANTQAAKGESGWFAQGLKDAGAALLKGVGGTVAVVMGTLIEWIFLPVANTITAIGGTLLDISLHITVSYDFRGIISSAVVPVWTVLRDTLNITFIFILLWAAIQMILGLSKGSTKKTIANVVIAAMLINFSLFATKIAIDAGNILAVAFINKIESSQIISNLKQGGADIQPSDSKKINLSSRIVSGLGITSAWSPDKNVENLGSTDAFIKAFLKLALSWITAIAFFIAALLLVARTIALVFLMALSPIGFMGDVLPMLKEYSKEWRETLYGQIMVAPVFLFFMYLILQIMGIGSAFKVSAETYNGLNPGTYFNYIIGIGMMLFAVKITKQTSGKIGGAFEKMGVAALGIAAGVATGGLALAGRQTIGRSASMLANSSAGKWLKDQEAKGSWTSKMVLKGMDGTAKATFDARNTKSFKNATDFIGEQSGVKVNYGKASGSYSKDGKSTGFAGQRKAEQEAENKRYTEIDKSVTPEEKKAATLAQERRDAIAATTLQSDVRYATAKARIDTLTDVAPQEVANETANVRMAEYKHRNATNQVDRDKAEAEITAAKEALDQKTARLKSEKRGLHQKEIGEHETTMETSKLRAEKEAYKQLGNDDKRLVSRAERAKNYANTVRRGAVGTGSFRTNSENVRIARGMQSQTAKTEAEKMQDMLKEIMEEQKKLAQNKP